MHPNQPACALPPGIGSSKSPSTPRRLVFARVPGARLWLLALTMPLAAALLVATPAWSQLKPKTPVAVCPRIPQAPKLDGRLDPGEWAAAGCLSDFLLLGGVGLPHLPTRVYVMHTAASLFIGAQMYDDKPSELMANVTQRDGKVYEDDCLEIFIDTEAGRKEYAHFIVNSLGTKYDAFNHDVAENFDWNVFAAVNETGWAIEMELPFDKGVPPLEGEVWHLGVCRNAARAGEMSTWARHARDFHEPTAFGELGFAAPLLTARIDDPGDRLLGDNLALVTVENLAVAAQIAKLNVVVMGSDRRSHYFGTSKREIPGRSSAQVYLPYKVRRCGPAWMTLSVTTEKGATGWRSAAYQVELPDVSDPLDTTAHGLAAAWKSWSFLQPSDAKDGLKRTLDELQKEWVYLDSQMAAAAGVPVARLSAISLEVQQLMGRVQAAQKQVEAARVGGTPLERATG